LPVLAAEAKIDLFRVDGDVRVRLSIVRQAVRNTKPYAPFSLPVFPADSVVSQFGFPGELRD
jgi:hypothetical protein